ncbi:flagellar motor protein MotB [Oceanicola sp. 502str15]|uniref:flagellar motor protein MotB n=1 Tax=Oceanicola sp. 502str15 TaxID=2696061 RepID=UPI002094FC97|nr:flagellar motor protein MotB [Oceanicola sp. 502str15]MCO6384792.1 chemotaxis protein MotB [Oceanicola sp. 502str15]
MSAANDLRPIIIKKKKIIAGDGHHGGAWKVAYADFVTAMMAFFLLMWLLNATTEKQRKGIADYFHPSVPLARVSGGGDGTLGGDSVFTEETLPQNGTGASNEAPTDEQKASGEQGENDGASDEESLAESAAIEQIEEALMAMSGESMSADDALRHIVTKVTDEGLIVEVFDIEGVPLFRRGTDEPTPIMVEIAGMLARVFDLAANEIAVNGHTAAAPLVLADNPVWSLSAARARKGHLLMVAAGMDERRFQRVSGFADRKLEVAEMPMSIRNNRLEFILLRPDT